MRSHPRRLHEAHAAHVHEHGHGHAGGASGRALVNAGQVGARAQVVEAGTDDLAREKWKVPEIVGGLQALGRQPVIVQDRAVVGDVRVGKLHEAPQPAELILPEQLRAQPLAPLQLREALEGGLPLQALV